MGIAHDERFFFVSFYLGGGGEYLFILREREREREREEREGESQAGSSLSAWSLTQELKLTNREIMT